MARHPPTSLACSNCPFKGATHQPLLLALLALAFCAVTPTFRVRAQGAGDDPSAAGEDIVLVQAGCTHRVPLLHASRVWRSRIPVRSFFLINDTEQVAALNADPAAGSHNEVYAFLEDDVQKLYANNVGSLRHALAPILAHRHFGDTYKWMLYGDDDTQFFLSGAMRLLSHLDPSQPLALTDHIWFADRRHDADAPKCLPCSFNTSFLHGKEGAYHPRPACPFCAVDLACARYGPQHRCGPRHDATFRAAYSPRLLGRPNGGPDHGREEDIGLLNRHYAAWFSSKRYKDDTERGEGARPTQQPDESGGDPNQQAVSASPGPGSVADERGGLDAFEAAARDERMWEASTSLPFPFCVRHNERVHSSKPPAGCYGSSFYGGSGLVVSVGLMRALDLAAAEQHIRGLRNATGGDYLLSRALEAQGFGLTDPGLHHLYDGGSRHYRQFGGHRRTLMDSLEAFALCSEPLQNPEVPPEERLWLLEHAVAQHARASHTDGAAELMARRAETHMALHAIASRLQRDPRVRAGKLALWEALRQDVCSKGTAPQPGAQEEEEQEEEEALERRRA